MITSDHRLKKPLRKAHQEFNLRFTNEKTEIREVLCDLVKVPQLIRSEIAR